MVDKTPILYDNITVPRKPGRPKKTGVALRYRLNIRVGYRTMQSLKELAKASESEVSDVARAAIESYCKEKLDAVGYLPGEKEDK